MHATQHAFASAEYAGLRGALPAQKEKKWRKKNNKMALKAREYPEQGTRDFIALGRRLTQHEGFHE